MPQDNFKRPKINPDNLADVVRIKWPDDILNEGIMPMPKKALRCLHKVLTGENSMKELSLILAIADFKRDKIGYYPSPEILSFISGLNKEEFYTCLKSLEKKRLIECEEIDDWRIDIKLDGFINKVRNYTDA